MANVLEEVALKIRLLVQSIQRIIIIESFDFID